MTYKQIVKGKSESNIRQSASDFTGNKSLLYADMADVEAAVNTAKESHGSLDYFAELLGQRKCGCDSC
jgi:hypothetical protein